jgi:hypothetical protein
MKMQFCHCLLHTLKTEVWTATEITGCNNYKVCFKEHCIEKYIALINRKRNNIFIANLKCHAVKESL